MKILALFFFSFISVQTFGQGYLFKNDNIQVTFPSKPIVDTTMMVKGSRIRSIIAKDSLSNYYLTLGEKLVKELDDDKNSQDITSFMDGVVDGMNKRYKATIISQRELEINGQKVGEYYTKGLYGQTPIFIKYWVFLKDAKPIICQHLYLVTHEARLQANQRKFFESIVL